MNDQVLDNVRDLLPIIASRAVETEDARRVPAETIAELTEAGFFRLLQPKRCGGLERNPIEFYESVRAIAGACGSTGWVASVMGVHPWQVGLLPKAAQDEVWGDDTDALIASSYAPIGKLTAVEGGYRLNGR
ncbi:MAG TPA: acyl-CoA dehydrogenase family protein, partial [Nocardioides sp.]